LGPETTIGGRSYISLLNFFSLTAFIGEGGSDVAGYAIYGMGSLSTSIVLYLRFSLISGNPLPPFVVLF
jgi:hypothetical protein